MTGRIIFMSTALGLAAAGAATAAPPDATPSTEAQQLMQNCDAHKFETVVKEVVAGQPHQSKVKLCGKQGQSDAEWIGTLKDAVSKIDSNKDMPAAVRDQIVTALNAEIGRLEIKSATALDTLVPVQKTTALDGISPLPPLPQAKPAETALAPRRTAPAAPLSDYAALPPIPTAPPPATHVLAGGVASVAAVLPKPRMRLSCYTPGGIEGPCTGFTRDTLLIVSAGEDLPADTSLSFVRDGDPKADVELAELKKGKSLRFAVPEDVCRHVVGGKLELRIMRSGQEVGSDGPYNLNC